MRLKMIGLGAAGNKAAICAVENGVMSIKDVMLINSTLKDIPADYQGKSNCHEFMNSYGGCGKERSLSFDLCQTSLENDVFGLTQFLAAETKDEAELVVLVASTEGGTGSGATPLIANFIRSCYGIPVHIYGLAGFEDDVRGMRNTVEFFKEMQPEFAVECTQNSNFLDSTGNKFKAEKEANAEFCKKISILAGLQLRDCDHNIDPTDLLKLSTTEGYMMIEYIPITSKLKNKEQFKQLIVDAIDNSKAMDPGDADQKRLGVIINIREESMDCIDYYDMLVDRFGTPYERFEHIQHEDNMPEFIAFIAAGLTLPTEDVENVYKNYENAVKKVNTGDSSSFFDTIRSKNVTDKDTMFEHHGKKKETVSKSDFFKSAKSASKPGFSSTKLGVELKEKDKKDEKLNEY